MNLADERKVKDLEQREDDLRKRELNDIRTLLSNASGRRFMWRLLEKCAVFESVFSDKSSTMAYLSGQQDLGHFLMSEIVNADENLLLKLMKENKKGEVNV